MIGRNNTLLTFVSFLFWTVTSIAQPSSLPFLHYDSSHSFPQIAISGFQQDSIGRLWISSEKNGLFCYDGNSVTHEVKKGVISFFIDDNFYVCCADSLCILKDRNLHAVFRGPLRNGVGKLPDGKIVFSSRTQVHTYCPKSGKTTSSIDPGYLITSQYVCGKTIYLGTSKGKLLTFDGEKFLEKASLSHEIVSIRENGDDGLFCCTLTAGLFLITQDGQISKRISTDTSPVSINSSCALDACMDEQHRLWVGTLNGLDIIDIEEETVSHYISNQHVHYSLSNNTVRRIFKDSQGGMWLGTYYGGVNYVHMSWNNFSHLTEGDGLWHLNDDIVNCMAMGNDDELFLGTNKKGINVCHLRTGRMEFIDIRKAAGFKSGEFNDVKVIWPEPGTNRIYIGCHKGGLLYMEKSSRKAHSILHNINISYVNRFTDGRLIVGTEENRYFLLDEESGNFTPHPFTPAVDTLKEIAHRYGVPSVASAIKDQHGTIWAASSDNLYSCNPDTDEIRCYSFSDGLRINYFLDNSACIIDSTKIAFGGIGGVVVFNPNAFVPSPVCPKPMLKEIRVNNEYSISGEHLYFLKLRNIQRHIDFKFYVPDFVSAGSNHLEYTLEGVDDRWYATSSDGVATYNNIPRGKYTLKVRAGRGDGCWNENSEALIIRKYPPWYSSSLGIVLEIILTMSILYFIGNSIRTRRLMERELEIKRIEERHQAEIEKLKVLNVINANIAVRPGGRKEPVADLDKESNRLLSRIIKVIEENISNQQLSTDFISSELGISRVSLYKKVGAITGSSPLELIHKIKFIEACRLLEQGELTIAEIAYKVGYSTPANFSTSFKRFVGCNPSNYTNSKHY